MVLLEREKTNSTPPSELRGHTLQRFQDGRTEQNYCEVCWWQLVGGVASEAKERAVPRNARDDAW